MPILHLVPEANYTPDARHVAVPMYQPVPSPFPERGGGGGGGGSEGAPDLRRVGSLHLETGRSAQHWLLRGLLVLVGADADAA